MKLLKNLLIGFVAFLIGCGPISAPPKARFERTNPDAAENVVRAVIADLLRIDSSAIPMDKPITEPPIKADDLDLVEIVMELEERQGVHITDAAIERHLGGKLGAGPPQITPNQLAQIVREAPKLKDIKPRK